MLSNHPLSKIILKGGIPVAIPVVPVRDHIKRVRCFAKRFPERPIFVTRRMSALVAVAGIYTLSVVSLVLYAGYRNETLCCFQPAWLRNDGATEEEEARP